MRETRAVILPDLYVDALAFLPAWRKIRRRLTAIARRGGGNLPVEEIEFKLGGNAANLAVSLARLGAGVELIAHTDALGHSVLQRAGAGSGLGTDGVRVGRAGSASLVLECGGANLMLSHAGPVARFGPEHLTRDDWERIESADVVAVVNWAQNQRGTDLLRRLSDRLASSDTFLYLDVGDVRGRGDDVRALCGDQRAWRGVDAVGMNENELGVFARGTSTKHARALAARLGTRIDLHTRTWAATATADSVVRVDANTSPARRLTGAGDAWNAGNLAGYLMDLDERQRLSLAHDVATAYVTDPDPASAAGASGAAPGGVP